MKATAQVIQLNTSVLVDQLGTVKAQIADLKAKEDELKEAIAASGETVCEGALFRCTVSLAERESVDWKAIAEKLGPSRQLVTAHTSTSVVRNLRVTARKTS